MNVDTLWTPTKEPMKTLEHLPAITDLDVADAVTDAASFEDRRMQMPLNSWRGEELSAVFAHGRIVTRDPVSPMSPQRHSWRTDVMKSPVMSPLRIRCLGVAG
jgi:hypothetical protein